MNNDTRAYIHGSPRTGGEYPASASTTTATKMTARTIAVSAMFPALRLARSRSDSRLALL